MHRLLLGLADAECIRQLGRQQQQHCIGFSRRCAELCCEQTLGADQLGKGVTFGRISQAV